MNKQKSDDSSLEWALGFPVVANFALFLIIRAWIHWGMPEVNALGLGMVLDQAAPC